MVSDRSEPNFGVPIDQPHIGKRIKQARKSAGMTQTELAKRLDVGQALIAKWESGQRNISIKSLGQVAKVCEVNLDFFIELNKHLINDEPPPENILQYVISNSNSLPSGLVKLAIDIQSGDHVVLLDDEWRALLGLARSWSCASTANKNDWLSLLFHLRSIGYLHQPHAA